MINVGSKITFIMGFSEYNFYFKKHEKAVVTLRLWEPLKEF